MEQRRLGNRNVAAIGFGTMSFGGMFGATDEATSLACLDAAVDAGIGHFDTANIYGMGVSEQIIGRWGRPDLHLATKCGIVNGPPRAVRNDEPYIRQCLEESLRRLKREHVDLYYIHRRQPDIPVEDVAGTMSKLVQEGKIGGYGLSEIAPSTLRRAHAEYPVTAVQSEFSLWTRLPQLGLIQACRELGVAFVAFSPLGRGMFGREPLRRDFRAGIDFRETNPRFTEPNFSANLAAIAPFRALCAQRGWTVPGAALAWVLAQGDHIVPIPATRTADHLRDWQVPDLDAADIAEIERILPAGFAHGDRYGDHQMAFVERYC
ncbi:aldo/keto reductase [Paracoccus denitrificans]|jgi:aryl-alcohol dehydrogenase-like predicted oxidoreductase|uniref:Aldo/keto reductase n=1 Tax=Paracoccus denitrificans (strain Pd 1222) TaxID=318586 RepID=A1BAU3_PARDP|nr:aldo/keto reductase [Paracoccus denitrificans]ABL72637.1 aldo/keto reductase [Paracoccus denitrificans PD1222]MBB4629630.1 aryl-alcohol dehydrogenase-like predicted oxidoreductase [Paracoccus denitrificans]MCU7431015.1 aldo/keto reductase [Paracoccus denitrificans]QAR29616.1 aldo/keto reductase [Paracoccus denitrificans]UFS67875.1 aldo/keto reductase [Paracoccus denitrificans]